MEAAKTRGWVSRAGVAYCPMGHEIHADDAVPGSRSYLCRKCGVTYDESNLGERPGGPAPVILATDAKQIAGYCPRCNSIVSSLDEVNRDPTLSGYPPNYLCRSCDLVTPEDKLLSVRMMVGLTDEERLVGANPRRVRSVDTIRIESLVRELLECVGEDPNREGLVDTPKRVAKFWREFIEYRDDNMNTTFESFQADQMVVVSGIPTWSLCEHHLLPFSATVSVGYIPRPPDKGGKILGLSKVARVVHQCAHRLQTQERLVDDVTNTLEKLLGDPMGIAVTASGVHTCMTMRGIRTPGVMTTSKVTGVFKRQQEVRQEFFSLIGHANDFGRW